jgi:hypothetical protein
LTKALQILFTLTLLLILVFWLGDLFLGTPADLSDRAVTKDWANDGKRYATVKMKLRLWTLVHAIPTLILLNATVKSIRQKNELLFYRKFLIGLTIFQIIPVVRLLKDKSNDPPFIFTIILTFFLIFISGQIFSVLKIVKITNASKII